MDQGRRDFLTGGLAFCGTGLLSAPSMAAPIDRARNFGLVELSTTGVTVSLYRLSRAMLDAPPGLSGYERLAPREMNNLTVPITVPLTAGAGGGAIDATTEIIAAKVEDLKRRWRLRPSNIAIIASSGVAVMAGDHIPALRSGVLARTSLPVDVVTPDDEARLQYDWVITGARRGKALQVDIGSGNTKGGYYDRPGRRARYQSFSMPFGSKTMAAAVKGRWPGVGTFDFPGRAADFYADTVAPLLSSETGALGQIGQMSELVLTGGVIWAAAIILHPREMLGNREWVPIAPDDFARLGALVESGAPYGIVPDDLTPDQRARLLRMRSAIRRIFNPHQIAAGAALGDGLSRQLDFAARRKLLFPTFANNSWRSQYLIERFVEGRSRVS